MGNIDTNVISPNSIGHFIRYPKGYDSTDFYHRTKQKIASSKVIQVIILLIPNFDNEINRYHRVINGYLITMK